MPSVDIPGLTDVPVVGILRRCPRSHARGIVSAAVEAGIRVVEVTLDSPEALDQLGDLRGLGEATLGVGTVVDPGQVEPAVEAGARFVVCPVVDGEIIDICRGIGVPCLPGAATPTEILTAWRRGAAAVKVFPAAQLGGPDYIRALLAPLGRLPLVPTGGVTPDDAGTYIEAGAIAVGAGTDLFPPEALERGDAAEIGRRALRWVEAVT